MLLVRRILRGWYIYFYCGVGVGVSSLMLLGILTCCREFERRHYNLRKEIRQFLCQYYFVFN